MTSIGETNFEHWPRGPLSDVNCNAPLKHEKNTVASELSLATLFLYQKLTFSLVF